MNTLSVALVWCVVQVTLVSLLAAGLYLALRRFRPAAATSVVFASLLMVVLLSLAALSPWPRWTFDKLFQSVDGPSIAAGASIDGSGERSDSTPGADRLNSEATSPFVDVAPDRVSPPSPPAPLPAGEGRSNAALFLQSLIAEISQPAAAGSTGGWRWPEVVAIVVLGATGFGVLWLVAGVVVVRRQGMRSRRVDDRALVELVDVVRAELSCRRPIEVRESDELVTAATIGWRRPVVLLPRDWKSWTAVQCRAVLAHEIAHAKSHDFLALLCGQIGLMLHFYHPIVHWLMNRMRLEQELAADAAAARISGGQRQYLTTIAELALSQQDRPLLWPARTFLPTRNTFLRRIAMLRDSNLRFERLSPLARALTFGTIALGGLFVAGLRSPVALQTAAAQDISETPRVNAVPMTDAKPGVVPEKTVEISAKADDSPSSSGGSVQSLSYCGESSTEKMSWADSGYAVLFERPTSAKSIYAVKLYGSRYGTPRAPAEKFHIYLLDEKQKVLEHILVPYAKVQRGEMKWHTFEFPAIEVPEKFYVAFWFDAEATKGVYVGKDMNKSETHSWTGLPDTGYQKVEEGFEWMIRAEVSDESGKKPTHPKVKTYEGEDTSDAEIGEVAKTRTWNDATGDFSLEGEFVELKDGKVVIKKTDGKVISIALDKLSKEDQEFAAKQSDVKKPDSSLGGDAAKELSRDDGKMADKRSIGGGGYGVRFEVDSDSYYVTSVSLHGSRYGEARPPQEDFNVWICDDQFKPIATFHFPYSSYARAAPAWKSFKIKPTKVPEKFIVCFGFNAHQTKGVYVSYDNEATTGSSLVGVPGQGEPQPFDRGDWLIRCKVEKGGEKGEK
jgi:beta-lactamase regulating signal transducer with metallopeptidase domain